MRVLLFGPPWSSKTLLARAVASEVKHNFLALKGLELFSKWVGESEKAVKSLFAKSATEQRQHKPSFYVEKEKAQEVMKTLSKRLVQYFTKRLVRQGVFSRACFLRVKIFMQQWPLAHTRYLGRYQRLIRLYRAYSIELLKLKIESMVISSYWCTCSSIVILRNYRFFKEAEGMLHPCKRTIQEPRKKRNNRPCS